MKALIIFTILLLSAAPVLAVNITVGNLTIMLPNITINATSVPDMGFNQTVKVDVLQIMRDVGLSDVINQQLGLIYQVFLDAISMSVVKSLEMMPSLLEVMVKTQISNC